MIQVDVKRCIGCGGCVTTCPNDCFILEDGICQVSHMNCMECGHCLAACPAGAILVEALTYLLGFETFSEHSGVSVASHDGLVDLVRLMRSRRSVRNYKDRPVALAVLRDLVKIGTTAPSGTNCQLWSFALLANREDVVSLGDGVANFFKKLNTRAANPLLRVGARLFAGDRLGRYYRNHFKTVQRGLDGWFERGEDHLFHGAPAVIVVAGATRASCPCEDSLLATGQILLAAHQMGLGCCLIGFAVEALKHDNGLRRAIGVRVDEEVHAVIALGYPDEQYSQPAPRKKVEPRIVRL